MKNGKSTLCKGLQFNLSALPCRPPKQTNNLEHYVLSFARDASILYMLSTRVKSHWQIGKYVVQKIKSDLQQPYKNRVSFLAYLAFT